MIHDLKLSFLQTLFEWANALGVSTFSFLHYLICVLSLLFSLDILLVS